MAFQECFCQVPVNMTINFNSNGVCNNAAAPIGTVCNFVITIMIPANTPTELHVELFSSNGTQAIILCKPSITYGSNYNLLSSPLVAMSSSFGDSRVIY